MSKTIKILYLEDEEIVVNIVRNLLNSDGLKADIVTAQTEQQFLEALTNHTFDLILADYSLPGFDGLKALRLLRERDKDVPFILFSGSIGEEKAIDSLRQGATDYVLKQNIHTLLPAIRKALSDFETKKKEARRIHSLRESESKFRLMADHTADWEYLLKPDGRFAYISPACKQITGYPGKVFQADPNFLFTIIKQDYLPGLKKHFAAETEEKELLSPIEFPILTREGKERWIEHRCKLVYNEKGEFIGRRCNNRDITERKHIEKLQKLMLRISSAALQIRDEKKFYQVLKQELHQLIDTTNFYIGLYNKDKDLLSFPYIQDENTQLTEIPASKTISRIVITEKRSLLLRGREVNAFVEKNGLQQTGPPAKCWLGVPLIVDDEAIGLITVQSYTNASAYDESDKYLLEFVANEIGASIKRKQMESLLEQLSRTVEQSPVSTVITDLDGTILYVNPKFCQITGYSCEEAIGKNPRILKSGETPPEEYKVLWDTISKGNIWHGRFHNRRKNGELFWEDATIGPIKDDQGRITHYVAVKEDITEKVEAENQFKRLYRQNELLNEIFPSALMVMDKTERVIRWNQKATELFGLQWEDVQNKHLLSIPLSWNWEKVLLGIHECRVEERIVEIKDVPFEKNEGTNGFLDIIMKSFSDEKEQIEGYLIVVKDVTKQKIIENMQIHAQKLESIGQLAAGIAHEINTPTQYVSDNIHFLNDAFNDLLKLMDIFKQMRATNEDGEQLASLLNKATRLAEDVDLEFLVEEIPAALSQTLDGINRISKIVKAMKEFSHPGSKNKTLVDLNRAIENTITVCRNEWKYVADVQTEFDDSLKAVPCYPDEFNQVMLNMIINSVHAISGKTNKNDGKGIIKISTHRNEDHAEIRISDNGSGIPQNIIDKIFDPFFTTKEVGKGTGQGLAISHDVIVNKHGGTIEVESEPGAGTTFTIRLPLDE